ncbi:MAG: hypothetical protein FJ146_04220 [Deltaproteobacteria bacterium]|nr:hypothetical protein [Deltaproteobacteria bacterium]
MWRQQMLFFVSCLLGGCTGGGKIWQELDAWVFERYGSTVFERPEEVALIRGVHLGLDNLSRSSVIIQGLVEEASPNGTYVVISDQSGRLLVVLSQLALENESTAGLRKKMLRVLGTVESGKKGLPFVRARAMWSLDSIEEIADQRA